MRNSLPTDLFNEKLNVIISEVNYGTSLLKLFNKSGDRLLKISILRNFKGTIEVNWMHMSSDFPQKHKRRMRYRHR